jgi:YD repeat-containing protein
MDMRDELDFDLEQFHFVNVARSRHRGIELGATVIGPAATTAALTYGLQNVVVGNGPNAGRFLRAIPRQTSTARLAHDARSGLSLSIDAVRVWNTPFDDANSVTLPAHTSADARVSYPVGAVRLIGETRNAFGARYNSTGFPDPGGSATRFYYPAAGRVVSIGAEARW